MSLSAVEKIWTLVQFEVAETPYLEALPDWLLQFFKSVPFSKLRIVLY